MPARGDRAAAGSAPPQVEVEVQGRSGLDVDAQTRELLLQLGMLGAGSPRGWSPRRCAWPLCRRRSRDLHARARGRLLDVHAVPARARPPRALGVAVPRRAAPGIRGRPRTRSSRIICSRSAADPEGVASRAWKPWSGKRRTPELAQRQARRSRPARRRSGPAPGPRGRRAPRGRVGALEQQRRSSSRAGRDRVAQSLLPLGAIEVAREEVRRDRVVLCAAPERRGAGHRCRAPSWAEARVGRRTQGEGQAVRRRRWAASSGDPPPVRSRRSGRRDALRRNHVRPREVAT